MTKMLSDLCSYADNRVAVATLGLNTYISTENMLPGKEGITQSSGLPTILQTQAYQAGDVLISNIRPYFRKIWFADRDGGCSNDILVLRAKERCNPGFLYYLLSDDSFFDYATATAKGTKMPRGDKSAIMLYDVPDLPIEVQCGIYDVLSALDARIANNKKINHHLAARSATGSLPDISFGSRASRKAAKRVDSELLTCICKNIGLTVSSKLARASSLGRLISSAFKTAVVMLGTAEPTFIPAKLRLRTVKYTNFATLGRVMCV